MEKTGFRLLPAILVGLTGPVAADLEENVGFWWGSGLEVFSGGKDLYYLSQAGYQWDDWRVFLEVGYVVSDTEFFGVIFETEVIPVTLNLSYEFDWSGRWRGFLGGGIGVAWIGTEVDNLFLTLDESTAVLAGQLYGGVSFQIRDNMWLDGTIRLLSLDEYGAGGFTVEKSEDISLGLGLRFQF